MNVEANHTPHAFAWYTGNPVGYHEKLTGKTITCADIYSGSLRIRAEDMVMLISTPVRYHMAGEKLPPKHQLFIEFDDFTAITCTIQMWGCMFCFKDGNGDGVPEQYKNISKVLLLIFLSFRIVYSSLMKRKRTLVGIGNSPIDSSALPLPRE